MHLVAYGVTDPTYNSTPPYHPDTAFPELPFREVSAKPNAPYALLRRVFAQLGLDAAHHGTPQWNPLGHLIQPGQTVLLKPNFVLNYHETNGEIFAVVTHPSILRALVDYAYVALRGEGRIIIADVPQMDCDWDDLMRLQRLDAVQDFYQQRFQFPIGVADFRTFAVVDRLQPHVSTNRKPRPGDPAGHVIINLGRRSHFYGLPNENHYGADYNRAETIAHHHGETQEYCVSRTMLEADVILSVPKLKTHKKVGVTLNLKGVVGMNTNKNYLIHYRLGTPRTGGDQLPGGQNRLDGALVKMQRWAYDHLLARKSAGSDALYRAARNFYRTAVKPFVRVSPDTLMVDGGNWHGNDSAWRMTADLAKILFFADAKGQLHDTCQRRLFCVVDGIWGGERVGPLTPDLRQCGCLIAGSHPFAVDLVATRLMGFDPRKLHQFDVGFDPAWNFGLGSLADIEVRAADGAIPGTEFFAPERRERHFGFAPHPGWVGQMEI